MPSPSSVAARIIGEFEVRPKLGCELEFYLDPPPDRPDELLAQWGCQLGRIPLFRSLQAEEGLGQFEVTTHPCFDVDSVVSALADLRETVTALAVGQGRTANFHSKRYPSQPGSALHVSLSLHNEANDNLLQKVMGEEQTWFAGAVNGLLGTLPQLMLAFAPTESCYERYREAPYPAVAFAPSRICWGPENRGAAIRLVRRVTAPQEARLEHRVAGASADPASVLAATLISVHVGLADERALVFAPTHGSPSHPLLDLPRLPTWLEAQRAFRERGLALVQRFISTSIDIDDAD